MTIIDPYISKESLDYLLTLENIQLKLELISCWEDNDPYTRFKREVEKTIYSTQEAIRGYQNYKIPLANVIWYNLGKGQNFHDRFIYIKNTAQPNGERDKIYLLSNSLNSLLKKYNFCILPLEGETKRRAQDYIKKLLSGVDKYKIWPKND